MMPIGPLMVEHRLIERMIDVIKGEIRKITETNKVDSSFVDVAVDLFRTYADRCHHGKEEHILFRDLAKKPLSREHKRTMDELIEEHVWARKTVGSLKDANESYVYGDIDALKDIVTHLRKLVEFYPRHIEKEDKHFFFPCMEYFSEQEQDSMLQEFWTFDRKMIHEKYREIVRTVQKEKQRS